MTTSSKGKVDDKEGKRRTVNAQARTTSRKETKVNTEEPAEFRNPEGSQGVDKPSVNHLTKEEKADLSGLRPSQGKTTKGQEESIASSTILRQGERSSNTQTDSPR